MRRDELTEQMIADARGPVESPFDEPRPPMMPMLTLVGESRDAYLDFCAAAAAVEAHQKQTPALMERYTSALKRLSVAAAKAVE